MSLPLLHAGRTNPGFNPASISGLQLWLDASDSSTLYQSSGGSPATADGDPVGYWADKSGNGRHLTQTDGTKKPALKTSVKNGKNGVLFDGVNDLLTSSAFQISDNNRWAYVVLNLTSTAKGVFIHGISDNSENFGFYFGTNQYYFDIAAGSGPYVDVTAATSSGFKIIGSIWTRPSSASVMDLFINGTTTTPTVTNGTVTPNALNYGFDVGRRLASYFDSHILELVYGTGILTTQDKSNLTGYLNTKWSIY